MTATRLVLNVEDFEPARFIRSRVLRRAGLEVVEAASAREAIEKISVAPPDLALIDIHLPDSDGFDLCRWLKTAHPDIPVLLISALHLTPSARLTALAAGAQEFVPEPVSADVLVNIVTSALAGLRRESRACWILTDVRGTILEASVIAADMLHFTASGLRGRDVLVYFGRDRVTWQQALAFATEGHVIRRRAWLRPRDRRPVFVDVEVASEQPGGDERLRWTFTEPDES